MSKVWLGFKKVVLWALHTASWVLALYLFASGNIWGGIGCAAVSIVQGLVVVFVGALIWRTPEYQEAMLEAKKIAREEGAKAGRKDAA